MASRSSRNQYGHGRFPEYVPVAQRQASVHKAIAAQSKKGQPLQPVLPMGRVIARSFWGKAWCDNLEAYMDYENRLARGRTYVRNGSVYHLEITHGKIVAKVMGSRDYKVSVQIQPVQPAVWLKLKTACTGQIGSAMDLLRGTLSGGIMALMTQKHTGLFPSPGEITFDCSCPDWATMCKHVAAVLYRVGARLDQAPELLFTLRGVDPMELIEQAGVEALLVGAPEDGSGLDQQDLSNLFGIELLEGEAAEQAPQRAPNPVLPAPATPAPQQKRTTPAKAVAPATPSHGSARTSAPKKPVRIRLEARVLTAQGIPHSVIQRWLASGVLEKTSERGVYYKTDLTDEQVTRYLSRKA